MDLPSADDLAMLDQAIEKATKLVRELERQEEELDQNPPKIPERDLSVGRTAMKNAIASARRTLDALHSARQFAREDSTEPESDAHSKSKS